MKSKGLQWLGNKPTSTQQEKQGAGAGIGSLNFLSFQAKIQQDGYSKQRYFSMNGLGNVERIEARGPMPDQKLGRVSDQASRTIPLFAGG